MTAYQRGNLRERRAIEYLAKRGYVCWQSRGSHGPADIIALAHSLSPLLVQVKAENSAITHAEWNNLYRLAVRVGAVPLLAKTKPLQGKRIEFEWIRLTETHEPYSAHWPASHAFHE